MLRTCLLAVLAVCCTLSGAAAAGSSDPQHQVPSAPLGWEIDPHCTKDWRNYFYRTADGSCNWLVKDRYTAGMAGTAYSRDHGGNEYADGISKPRGGPNSRAVSNAIWPKTHIPFNHNAFLAGFVQYLMHDVTWSEPAPTPDQIAVPKCDGFFDPNCTGTQNLIYYRSAEVPGTGTSRQNPRETKNSQTPWFDGSAMYGVSDKVHAALRVDGGTGCKLEVQRAGPDAGDYLPFNTKAEWNMVGRGQPQSKLFRTGDPRANQDWLLLVIETLLLREHNRICDLLVAAHPAWDNERLWQYAKAAMGVRITSLASEYGLSYGTSEFPFPQNDITGLFRSLFGVSIVRLNQLTPYPSPYAVDVEKKLIRTVSNEMDICYRFHEIIPTHVEAYDPHHHLVGNFSLVETAFDSESFLNVGLDALTRGMLRTPIPNFRSGVADAYRNIRVNLRDPTVGNGMDLAAWAVEHERERGLPSFNSYWRRFSSQIPKPVITLLPRLTFEEFSSDPDKVAALKKLYNSPEDVDLMVGLQLDESNFPGTELPTGNAITALISLFYMGTSDRHGAAAALGACISGHGRPWNCVPSSVTEDLLWQPLNIPGFPNMRWMSDKWMGELLPDGAMWKLIHDNTNVKCLQVRPFLPLHPQSNPSACTYEEVKKFYSDLNRTHLLDFARLVLVLVVEYTAIAFALVVIFVASIGLLCCGCPRLSSSFHHEPLSSSSSFPPIRSTLVSSSSSSSSPSSLSSSSFTSVSSSASSSSPSPSSSLTKRK